LARQAVAVVFLGAARMDRHKKASVDNLHKGAFEMAAAYALHIAENQPFLDGNKRTALNAAIAFLGHRRRIAAPAWRRPDR
jgi:prophage maintenance system killer protein